MRWSFERGQSFQQSVAASGFVTHFYQQPKEPEKRTWENELTIMADWLAKLPKPVGLMTCNDDRAQQIIEACKIANLHVPEQIAVVGVDNDELVCELSEPPLSSVVLNAERAGYEAAELLDQLMAGEKMVGQTIWARPSRVVTRKSTDILAIEDKDVADAIRFIRENAKKAIQVDDVVRATAISRRVLEKRFRKEVGRSIFGEIKRNRTDLIARMLLETDWSVSQIALKSGFSNIDHFSRYFRQEMGIRPLAFRKNNT
jgi:LacI family transcriptional regulator